jgi:RNA polymerase sigma-70 factor (ECF subfamily)
MNSKDFYIVVYPVKDKVYRFARRLLNDNSEAEDLTQDLFLKLWQMKDSLDSTRNIEALAMKSIKNLCFDRIKKKKPILADVESDYEYSMVTDTMKDFENQDITSIITHIVDSLPENLKLVFHLKDIEGYEYDEIEKISGLDRNILKVNLSRARKRIREILIKRYSYEYR